MKPLLSIALRGALFATPVLLLLAGAVTVMSRTGELDAVALEQVVAWHGAGAPELLFGPAYSDCTPRYKLLAATARRPEVLVMGSSRSMEIRGELFRAPFYNAGGATLRARDSKLFLARIPEAQQPKLIVLALDQFTVSAAVDRDETQLLEPRLEACVSRTDLVLNNWTSVYRDLATRKIPRQALSAATNDLGIAAKVDGRGFRRDGSNRPGRNGTTPFSEVFDRIARKNYRFQYDDAVSPALVAHYAEFCRDAARRGIHVVAFLPPYAPQVLDRMKETGGYGYLEKIHPTLAPIFEQSGHTLADYTDTRSLGLTDENFIDGFHGSERAYARIIQELGRIDPALGQVIDAERIEALLGPGDPLTVSGGI